MAATIARRQFDAEHKRIENLDRVLQEVVVVFGIRLFHGLGLDQAVEMGTQALLRIISNFFLNLPRVTCKPLGLCIGK